MSNTTGPINPISNNPVTQVAYLSNEETKILRRFLDLIGKTNQPIPSNGPQFMQLINSLSGNERELFEIVSNEDGTSPLESLQEEIIRTFLDETGRANQPLPADQSELTWLIMNISEGERGLFMKLVLERDPQAFKLL